MNINHLIGTDCNNLYAVLGHDNWGLGDPEGLAHWDGVRWIWIAKFENCWTKAAILHEGRPMLLDVEGSITHVYTDQERHVILPPNLENEYSIEKYPACPAFSDLCRIETDTYGVVGENGLFYIYKNKIWTRILTGTNNTIHRICGIIPDCYLCGDNIVMRYDGERCSIYYTGCDLNFSDMDANENGDLYLAAWTNDRRGYLCRLIGEQITPIIETIPLWSIVARADEEVYCGTNEKGVLRWEGTKLTSSLASITSSRLKTNGNIFFASGENDNIIYMDPPNWNNLHIDLDQAFILPQRI